MRRYIILLLTLIPITIPSLGQHAVGSWDVYSNFGIDRGDVIDTKNRVYFCGGGSLFHYDKDIDETYSYNMGNGMSDISVERIFRNYDRNYIVVVYANSNMDVVYDTGDIVNMSDIKDAQYVADKTINDIEFDGDDMFAATSFGVVRYNMKNNSVSESGMFSFPVHAVAVSNGKLLIGTDTGLYGIDKNNNRINDFKSYKKISDDTYTYLSGYGDKWVLGYQTAENRLHMYEFDFNTPSINSRWSWVFYGSMKLKRFGDYFGLTCGSIAFICGINENGNVVHKSLTLPSTLYTTAIYMNGNSDGACNDLWYINDYGLGHLTYPDQYFNITDASSYTIDREPDYPMGTIIHGGPTRLAVSDAGIYTTFHSHGRFPSNDKPSNLLKINLIDNGFIYDKTPKPGEFTTVNGSSENKLLTGYKLVPDPVDPSIIYVPTWFEGIWKFQEGKQIGKYDKTNGPFGTGYSSSVQDVAFDSNNNLWAIANDYTKSREIVAILPAAKNTPGSNISIDDWIVLDLPDFGSQESRDSKIVHFRHFKNRNLALITQTFGDKYVIVYDTNGTSAISDDKYYMLNRFTDQDGKTFGPYTVISIAEDNNGDIWLGTECGVIVIHNLRTMLTNRDNTIERVKVPRNDGTSLADYLLDNQAVTSIAVDAGNKKWIGTTNSGAYYVSADGREILENFNRDNSMIPSDAVQSIVCDPNSNDVYVGTTNGLGIYHSMISPASHDLSDVYAFPNPVRPEYTGWITIKGLMDNSLVKIADSAGNVFLQTRSEGGTVIWDGCNAAGERVPTGVYYVYASQNQDNNSNGAVAKILVVK